MMQTSCCWGRHRLQVRVAELHSRTGFRPCSSLYVCRIDHVELGIAGGCCSVRVSELEIMRAHNISPWCRDAPLLWLALHPRDQLVFQLFRVMASRARGCGAGTRPDRGAAGEAAAGFAADAGAAACGVWRHAGRQPACPVPRTGLPIHAPGQGLRGVQHNVFKAHTSV